MYSTHHEGKSVATERFIRTLKNNIYKQMTSISKNVYIEKLDDIVNEYNNTYHRRTKQSLLMLKIIHILTPLKKLKINILSLNFVMLLQYQNIKTFLLKNILQIGLKMFL